MQWVIAYDPSPKTEHLNPIYEKDDWAKGFDVVGVNLDNDKAELDTLPGRMDPADFVLQPVPKRMETDIAIAVDQAADAVRSLIVDGLAATQDRFNGSTPER